MTDRARSLCSEATNDKHKDLNFIQVITKTFNERGDSLAQKLAPVLITEAIRSGSINLVKEVYKNCHYLPKLASEVDSTHKMAQNLGLIDD